MDQHLQVYGYCRPGLQPWEGDEACARGAKHLYPNLDPKPVQEESGVSVDLKTLQFESSQPWLFPSSLMVGFRVRPKVALSGAPTPRARGQAGILSWFGGLVLVFRVFPDRLHPEDGIEKNTTQRSVRYIESWTNEISSASD